MAHTPIHIDPFDFSIEIKPPVLPLPIPPKIPTGCFSLELPTGSIMAFIRMALANLESQIRAEIESVKDQIEQQIRDKIPTKQEIIDYIMSHGCEQEPQVTEYYNALKDGLKAVYAVIDGVKKKIDGVRQTIEQLKGKVEHVENIINGLKPVVTTLQTVVSVAKIAINFFPPSTQYTPFPLRLYSKADEAIKVAYSTMCVMGGNIEGIPPALRAQIERLNEFVNIINPYVTQMDEIINQIKELEAILEAYYLQWLANCNDPANQDPSDPGTKDDNKKYLIEEYQAITDNIDKYPKTQKNDWNLLKDYISPTIPANPPEWANLDNYVINNKVILVFGPPPPTRPATDENGQYRIDYYAAITNNIDQYPEINPDDWNLLKSEIVDVPPPGPPPEWANVENYIISDQVMVIIPLGGTDFSNTITGIVNSGNTEYIKKVYNANFSQIGYRRYFDLP
tara:strand:- start:10043 stop:11398 length:1356 start_codon:yes stop_codon:yes gene_type:complete